MISPSFLQVHNMESTTSTNSRSVNSRSGLVSQASNTNATFSGIERENTETQNGTPRANHDSRREEQQTLRETGEIPWEEDPANAHNWSQASRVFHSIVPGRSVILLHVCILIISSWCCIHSVRRRPYLHIKDSTAYKNRALASSLYTPAIKAVQKEFDVSAVIAIFPFSFYVLGLAFGPMIGSPLSETLGRRRVYQISLPVFALFILGSGFAKGIGTLVVCRFLAGLWGSPALSIGSATVSDVWPPAHRAIPMAAYVAAPFMGPALG